MDQEQSQNRRPPEPQQRPEFDWRQLIWLLALILALLYWRDMARDAAIVELPYSQFKAEVTKGYVQRIDITGQQIRGQYRKGSQPVQKTQSSKPQTRQFRTTRPPFEDPDLMPLLEENGVTVKATSTRAEWWQRILIQVLPWVLILGALFYLSLRMQQRMASSGGGGPFGFGRSQAKKFREEKPQARLDDVAGSENAKRDVEEIIQFLRKPEHYHRLGAKLPRGVLLTGPPGTGKTLLARAVAGEAEVPFYSISGSEFIEMFVGVGAARVRDMFKDAKAESPSIIFIDEIDAIGRARGAGLGGGHDEREQTLNQILSEMDGFSERETVVVLAATNRPDVLDQALLRPGRFDRKVTMDLPTRSARGDILKVHLRDVPLADDVDVERLAERTMGFSGADLANLVNEAALAAGRRDRQDVDAKCFAIARDKIVLGERREDILTDEERRLVAYHESGHALMAYLLPHADPLDRVTVIPHGRALGATEQMPKEERYNMNESYLRDRIGVMLGGRAAERLIFGETSHPPGAADGFALGHERNHRRRRFRA